MFEFATGGAFFGAECIAQIELANFGVPTGGKTLQTRGITWHQLDGAGKIARETTYWNDTPVLQELGLPILTPAYWAEGFDPAALAP